MQNEIIILDKKHKTVQVFFGGCFYWRSSMNLYGLA